MLMILAFVCLVLAAVWGAVTKAWPFVLLAAGLTFWALAVAGPIRIG